MAVKGRIMLVDDNKNLTKSLSFALEHKGYDIVIAESGFEAIEKIKQQTIDIIFMDIKMPVMNGVETFKMIKNIIPESIVIMMTAYAVEDLVKEALNEGAYGIIYKPLDINDVILKITQALETKKGAFILLVEDDPSSYSSLMNILEKKGSAVGIAPNGEIALEMVGKTKYDIIFIDMKLPTINGLETYLKIRELDKDVIAIIMTAYRQETSDLVQQALSQSAYACLYKPIDTEKMLEMVDEIISKKEK